MHIVIIFVLLLALGYLLTLALRPGSPKENAVMTGSAVANSKWGGDVPVGVDVAFISSGNLFYKTDSDEVRQLHSPYIQEMTDRLEKTRERNAWKQNTSFGISAGGNVRQFDGDATRIVATSAHFDNGHILYFLKDDAMGGLFTYDFAGKTENRLLHKQNLNLCDLNLEPASGKILAGSKNKDGTANIVMLDRDGSQMRALTAGDTFDSSPSWASVEEKEILYQSSGLARDERGYVIAQGNASIQQLNMRTGNITPVLEDARFDFMQPRVCGKGDLHFIRRPYEMPKYATQNFLLDALLFPFRLLRAVFHYLNFFSMMYTRKPLTSASGPAVNADMKEIILKGKRIDAEKALRKESAVNGVPSLVPRSWQLIKRTRQGVEEVLATNVLSYTITAEGSVVYSNGRGVFLLEHGTSPKLILKSDLVDDVVAH